MTSDPSCDTPPTRVDPLKPLHEIIGSSVSGSSVGDELSTLETVNSESGGNRLKMSTESTFVDSESFPDSCVSGYVNRFQKALKESGSTNIDHFLPTESEIKVEVLAGIAQVEMESRFRKGEWDVSSLEYLEKYPELSGDMKIVLNLLSKEMAVKQRDNAEVEVELYQGRFPAIAPAIHALAVRYGFNPPFIKGYTRLVKIAGGGMGVIYSARDTLFGRDVAIKVMRHGMSGTAFDREIHIMANLPHPCIPPIHAKGLLADGRPYFVMKWIHGKTLKESLDQRSKSEEGRSVAELSAGEGDLLGIFENMCQAVGYAHSMGVVHRDLKPANIMVGAFGEVQVMDWGLAKTVESGKFSPVVFSEKQLSDKPTLLNHPEGWNISHPGAVKGTAPYMAPEQARGEPADARSDVFSLGGILLEMLTGKPPFHAETQIDAIELAAKADLSKAFGLLDRCDANPDLIKLCKWSLAADPSHRPGDAKALALAMVQYRMKMEEQAGEVISRAGLADKGNKRLAGVGLRIAVVTSLFWIIIYLIFIGLI